MSFFCADASKEKHPLGLLSPLWLCLLSICIRALVCMQLDQLSCTKPCRLLSTVP